MYRINVEGTRRVLRAAREAGVSRVIFTSSAAVIGLRRDGFPADERLDYSGSPQQFPYAYSKLMAERVARHAVQEYEQDIVTLNPVIVLGPGDLNMISGRFVTETRRLQWIIPVTKGRIGVVDVRDVARWHLLAAEEGKAGYRYILGTANYHLYDWYRLCAEVVGVAPPFIHVPAPLLPLIARLIEGLYHLGVKLPVDASQVRLSVKRMHFNYSAAHEAFGAPQIPMRQSLEDTYRWYGDNGYLKPDPLADLIARVGRLLGRRA
jgi:dihydroflavonol-4-reductase